MSGLASIFEASDNLGNPTPSEMPALFAILDRCWSVDAALQKFFIDLQSTADGPLYWNRLSTLELLPEEADGEKLFPVAFHFKSLSFAFTTNMYWMACILTYRTIMELYQRIMRCAQTHAATPPIKSEDGTSPQSPGPSSYMLHLLPLGERKNLVGLAKNIAQTVEFCIQEDKKSQGPGMFTSLNSTLCIKVIHRFKRCRSRWGFCEAVETDAVPGCSPARRFSFNFIRQIFRRAQFGKRGVEMRAPLCWRCQKFLQAPHQLVLE